MEPALKASMLQANRVLRLTEATLGAARLLSQRDGAAWELWAIGEAVGRRLEQLQTGWIDAWFQWLRDAARMEGAGTLAKLSAHELDLASQASRLVCDQAVTLLTLMENTEVAVLYWVRQRSAPPAAAAPEPERRAVAAE
jgi:hypothetical protein